VGLPGQLRLHAARHSECSKRTLQDAGLQDAVPLERCMCAVGACVLTTYAWRHMTHMRRNAPHRASTTGDTLCVFSRHTPASHEVGLLGR